jgi:hypothetical protein
MLIRSDIFSRFFFSSLIAEGKFSVKCRFFYFFFFIFFLTKNSICTVYSWKQTFGWVWFRPRLEGWTKRIVDRVPYVRASSQIVNLTKLSREITHKEPTRNIDSTASKRTQQQLYNANVRVLYVYVYLSSWKTSKQLGFRSKWCDPCSIMYGFFFSCLNVFPLRFIDETFQL